MTRHAAAFWIKTRGLPLVMYFHIWELDNSQPDITAAGLVTRLRHYRNLTKMRDRIRYFLQRYRFTSAQNYLHLAHHAITVSKPETTGRATLAAPMDTNAANPRTFLSVVIPCFNEEASLS